MKLKPNKKIPIEQTIGSGLATLLAKNLKLADSELPEKEMRINSDVDSLAKIRDLFGEEKIIVIPKQNGAVEIKVKGGIIMLTP